jgi:sialate O-acetylesterase
MFIDTLQQQIGGAAGVVDISWSGTRCWAWMPRETIDAHEELKAERLRQEELIAKGEGAKVRKPVLRCWNNMFYPVSKMSCRGIIWYQGCCDSGHRDSRHLYPKWLSYMVADMRRELGKPHLPFLYCQLAGWQHLPASPDANPGPANLREGQRRAQKLIPDSAMAVILDNSEHEIHGRFKGPAGDRLAALALNRVYGRKEVVCKSPDFAEATFGPSSALIRFDVEGSPLAAHALRESFTWNAKSNDVIRIVRRSSPASQLEGFTIRGADGTWRWADARITGRDTVKVWADGAANPTAVRYNWGMQGFGNLYNAAGLPASCFTTEP